MFRKSNILSVQKILFQFFPKLVNKHLRYFKISLNINLTPEAWNEAYSSLLSIVFPYSKRGCLLKNFQLLNSNILLPPFVGKVLKILLHQSAQKLKLYIFCLFIKSEILEGLFYKTIFERKSLKRKNELPFGEDAPVISNDARQKLSKMFNNQMGNVKASL